MIQRSRFSLLWLAAGLFAVCLAGQPVMATSGECVVEIASELAQQQEVDDGVRLRYEVKLTSETDCAEVVYDLILVELLPNGQWKSVRKTRRTELSEGRRTDVVEHVIASDLKVIEHEAREVECVPCNGPERSSSSLSVTRRIR